MIDTPEHLTHDFFLDGRVAALQPKSGFRSGTDAVFMAAAVPAKAGQHVLELGCGAGVAALCLVARTGARVTGLELQPDYAALARENGHGHLTVMEGDVVNPPDMLRQQSFDHVMFNPPYYAAGTGPGAQDNGREQALRENLPIETWVRTGLRRLRSGGTLTVIVATDRLANLLSACHENLGSLVILPLLARAGKDAKRIVLQGVKGGRSPLRLMSPLILHPGDRHGVDAGAFTPQAEAILRDAAPLIMGPRGRR